jgi:hypothetical protein
MTDTNQFCVVRLRSLCCVYIFGPVMVLVTVRKGQKTGPDLKTLLAVAAPCPCLLLPSLVSPTPTGSHSRRWWGGVLVVVGGVMWVIHLASPPCRLLPSLSPALALSSPCPSLVVLSLRCLVTSLWVPYPPATSPHHFSHWRTCLRPGPASFCPEK